jgi:hypothetical protein
LKIWKNFPQKLAKFTLQKKKFLNFFPKKKKKASHENTCQINMEKNMDTSKYLHSLQCVQLGENEEIFGHL